MNRAKKKKTDTRDIKIIVEKHADTYIAYPLGINGSCVGQGDSYDEALTCVRAMLKSHIAALGDEAFTDVDSPVQEAFVAEARISA